MVVLRFKIILDMQSKFASDIFKIWSKIISAIIDIGIKIKVKTIKARNVLNKFKLF